MEKFAGLGLVVAKPVIGLGQVVQRDAVLIVVLVGFGVEGQGLFVVARLHVEIAQGFIDQAAGLLGVLTLQKFNPLLHFAHLVDAGGVVDKQLATACVSHGIFLDLHQQVARLLISSGPDEQHGIGQNIAHVLKPLVNGFLVQAHRAFRIALGELRGGAARFENGHDSHEDGSSFSVDLAHAAQSLRLRRAYRYCSATWRSCTASERKRPGSDKRSSA